MAIYAFVVFVPEQRLREPFKGQIVPVKEHFLVFYNFYQLIAFRLPRMHNIHHIQTLRLDPIHHPIPVFPRHVIPQSRALDPPPHLRKLGNQSAQQLDLTNYARRRDRIAFHQIGFDLKQALIRGI